MEKIINILLKIASYFYPLQNFINKNRQIADLQTWQGKPRSLPLPHLLKQDILKNYAREYNLSFMVETGTYRGEMVEAMKNTFKKIYSIELSEKYARTAQRYFYGQKHVKIIQGDSGTVIGELIKEIDQPTLFWLDGHYSANDTAKGDKETPVMEELTSILKAADLRHVILVDDARAFGKAADYPTMKELETFVHSLRRNVQINSEDDIIRILPV